MEHALTKYRNDNALSLEAFAGRIGTTKAVVWKWENGSVPRKPFMEKIVAETNGAVAPNDWYPAIEAAE